MEHAVFDDETALDPFARQVPGFGLGRDGARTPMQWEPGPNAGFSDAEPWLPVTETDAPHTVAGQRDDPSSFFSIYRRLIRLRRASDALKVGSFRALGTEGEVLLYLREHGDERLLVALNLGQGDTRITFDGAPFRGVVSFATDVGFEGERVEGDLVLRGGHAVVIAMDS